MNRVGDLGEFNLIGRIARLLPTAPSVVEGIGDDCAVARIGDRFILLTADLSIEEIHFSRRYSSPENIGWKAATASLSDIASMGGTPLFGVTALACPPDTDVAFVEQLYQGMANAMSRFGATIVGGDTTRSVEGVIVDVMVVGEVRGPRFLRRKGAQIGDLLAVTGHLGLSAAGLHALQHGLTAPTLVHNHRQPSSRVREGQWLAGTPSVHAMIDISDGLVQDAGHLADASQLGINIFPERLPVYPPLTRFGEENAVDTTRLMLTGGEDYELLFALSAEGAEKTLEEFHREFRTAVPVIGEFTDAWTGVRLHAEPTDLAGYDHFRKTDDAP